MLQLYVVFVGDDDDNKAHNNLLDCWSNILMTAKDFFFYNNTYTVNMMRGHTLFILQTFCDISP
jgi:hypothetical protein